MHLAARRRVQLNLRMQDCANALNIGVRRYRRLEYNEADITAVELEVLMEYLGLTQGDIKLTGVIPDNVVHAVHLLAPGQRLEIEVIHVNKQLEKHE